MKKILSTAFAIILFIGVAQAQTTEHKGHQQKGQRKEHSMQRLNLTAEQKAQFQSLREAQRKEMQDLKKSGNATPEQRKAIQEKYKTQYQAMLTPAQKETIRKKGNEKKDKDKKDNRGQAYGTIGGDFGAQAAFFRKELNLTNDQETQLKSIFQEFRTKAQEVRSSTSLTNEQKRDQFQLLASQYMTQGKAVLSPEQLKKYEELTVSRRKRG